MSNFYNNVTALQDISGIVTNESARLDAKQKNIDQAYDNQKRMILLNQSYGQRMQQYTFISIILAITFIIIIFLLFLQKRITIIPSSVYELIMVLLIAGVGIYIFNLYNNIISRDKLDFSKLSHDSPNVINSEELKKLQDKAVADGKILNAIVNPNLYGTCVGSACCASGKTFDETTNLCQAFTTLEEAYSKNGIVPK